MPYKKSVSVHRVHGNPRMGLLRTFPKNLFGFLNHTGFLEARSGVCVFRVPSIALRFPERFQGFPTLAPWQADGIASLRCKMLVSPGVSRKKLRFKKVNLERPKRDDDNREPQLVDQQMLHLKPLSHFTIQKRDNTTGI